MREIITHRVNPAHDPLRITVEDQPGSGGAHHLYRIGGFNAAINPSSPFPIPHGDTLILFQNGPIHESGVNGITQEALIAVCIDRLEAFQAGPFACIDNAVALVHLRAAQEMLLYRTRSRMARGVEGTHQV